VIGSIQRVRARLSAANNCIEQHARINYIQGSRSPRRRRSGGANGAYNQAWLAVRRAASEIVHDVTVPLLRWCDTVAPPAELVEVLVPTKAAQSLQGKAVEASLLPAIAGVYLRSVPLRAVLTVLCACGLMSPLMLFFNVSSAWWLGLSPLLSWPQVLCCAASLNRVTVKQLMNTFQTVFVGLATLTMVAAFCFLWRRNAAEIAAFSLLLPQSLLAMFMDAYPEAGRPANSRLYFAFNLAGICAFQAGIAFSKMPLEDQTFEVLAGKPIKVTSIASTCLINIAIFGVKNLVSSLRNPGSLAVVKSPLRSKQLPLHLFRLAEKAHALLVLSGADRNATLKRELERSKSKRKGSIASSFNKRGQSTTKVSPLDLLPIVAGDSVSSNSGVPLPAHHGTHWSRVRVWTEPVQQTGDARAPPPAPATAGSLRDLAASLTEERELLVRIVGHLPPTGGPGYSVRLRAETRLAAARAASAAEQAMAIVHSTNFVVDKAQRTLCHAPSARPFEIKIGDTLVPRLSVFLGNHRRLRFGLHISCNIAWLLGAAATYLLLFDSHSDTASGVWMVAAVVGTLPVMCLTLLTFHRTLLLGIATTFQTALVCGYATTMVAVFCALFHEQPCKLAAMLMALPSFTCGAFMDAYPEGRRVSVSRLFFVLNLLGLLANQAGLAFGLISADEFTIDVYDGWAFGASELAASTTSSLIVFAVRNLLASVRRSETLAVRESDMVCVSLDDHALRVLVAVHALLV
jgi:hypothetical protein